MKVELTDNEIKTLLLAVSSSKIEDLENIKIKLEKLIRGNKVQPQTRSELKQLVVESVERNGTACDLNFIDVSKITDMSNLFLESRFNGDISEWDVSNVKTMSGMFYDSKFNGDISKWDVSNVKDMDSMFSCSKFNGDISKWDVSNVKDMSFMFENSPFKQNISKWDVSKVKKFVFMFDECPIENKPKYQPKFL